MAIRRSESPLIDEDALLREMALTSETEIEDLRSQPSENVPSQSMTGGLSEQMPDPSLEPSSSDSSPNLGAATPDIEKQTREWRILAKVVDHNFEHLVSAQLACDAAYRALAEVESEVDRSATALSEALSGCREDNLAKDLEGQFSQVSEALEKLEKIAAELSVAHAWCRSAWRVHTQSLKEEQAMRAAIQSSGQAA